MICSRRQVASTRKRRRKNKRQKKKQWNSKLCNVHPVNTSSKTDLFLLRDILSYQHNCFRSRKKINCTSGHVSFALRISRCSARSSSAESEDTGWLEWNIYTASSSVIHKDMLVLVHSHTYIERCPCYWLANSVNVRIYIWLNHRRRRKGRSNSHNSSTYFFLFFFTQVYRCVLSCKR